MTSRCRHPLVAKAPTLGLADQDSTLCPGCDGPGVIHRGRFTDARVPEPPETKQALNHEIPCWSSLASVMGVKIVVNPSLARPRLRQIQQEWETFEAPQFARNV